MPCLFGQLDAFIDGGMGRYAVEKNQLEGGEAQSDPHRWIQLRTWPLEERANLSIEPELPTKDSKHESRGEIAIRSRQTIDRRAAKQLVRVTLPLLHGQQTVECCLAGW